MHIVNYDNDPEGYIFVAPREPSLTLEVPFVLNITDEERNVETLNLDPDSWTIVGNYLRFSFVDQKTLINDRYYSFRVISFVDGEIYRGKIYVTDQDNLEKFSINNGEFTYYEEGTDNQYIYR
jgi:hypothetical protein